MRILDKYIAKNFLTGYLIAFLVLMGLRIIIDLFVNLDEFTENDAYTTWMVIQNMLDYYGTQSFLYFRDFAGMITVVAAAFSLGKLIRNNELVAIMASGVSLKRVIAPIIFIAVILTGVFIIDQEIIIPKFADKLVRKQEDKQSLDVWFMNDDQGSLICSPSFDIGTDTLNNPIIFLREPVNEKYSHCVGQIRADSATYVGDGKWELINGIYLAKPENPLEQFAREVPIEYYETDLTPQQIPVRRQVNYMDLLSSRQLTELAKQTSQVKDLAELYSQKHNKITTPIINMIMLLISLPLLVCREPKAMKSAVTLSFVLTTLCFLLDFGCKMAAGEGMLLRPELWSWLPVFIFAPIVFIELETMKT